MILNKLFYFCSIYYLFILNKQCIHSYEHNYSYEYEYSSVTILNSAKSNTNITYLFKSILIINQSNENLIFNIKSLQTEPNDLFTTETLKYILNNKFQFNLKHSNLKTNDQTDNQASLLFKKSLLNLFNINLNKTSSLFYGNCEANIRNETRIENELNLFNLKIDNVNCEKKFYLNEEFKRNEKILNSIIQKNVTFDYFINKEPNFVIQSLKCNELVKISLEFSSKLNQEIKTEQILKLLNVVKNLNNVEIIDDDDDNDDDKTIKQKKIDLNSFDELNDLNLKIKNNINNDIEKKKVEKSFDKYFKLFNKKYKSGSFEASKIFLQNVKSIRSYLSTNEKLLDNVFKTFINKEKIGKFVLEVYTASQTNQAIKTIIKNLNINKLSDASLIDIKQSKLIEEFLISSSLITQSNDLLYDSILNIFNNDLKLTISESKIKSALTLGSLINLIKYSTNISSKYLNEYYSLIYKQIEYCETEECLMKYLESFKNARLDASFNLISNLDNCDKLNDLCLFNLKSLKNFQLIKFKNESNYLLFDKLMQIFFNFNSSYSNEIRAEALNLLLSKYINNFDASNLENVLITMQNDYFNKQLFNLNKEFLFYIQRLIIQMSKRNVYFKSNLERIFSSYKSIKMSYFTFLTFTGSSNVLINNLKTFQSNNSLVYNLNQLMTNDALIRSIEFSISLLDNMKESNIIIDLLKFELYAKDLNMLSQTKSDTSTNSNSDPTASIHLSIMGQKLKIIELFRGYTSMLSLLWSLPTKPTSLFNINFLICDQNEYVLLSNGFLIRVENLGALSFNLNAVSDVSLWSQYAKINMKASASLAIEQTLSLINDFKLLNRIENDFDTQISIDFNMDTDFKSKPYKMCINMSQNKFYLRQRTRSFDSNKTLINEMSTQMPIHASTFMFSRDSVKFC